MASPIPYVSPSGSRQFVVLLAEATEIEVRAQEQPARHRVARLIREQHAGSGGGPPYPEIGAAAMRTLAVFCGSAVGVRPVYAEAAVALAEQLAARQMQLVYGGGGVGIMGVLADAALARGVPVIGVIPQHLEEREVGHKGLTRMEVVPSMHVRKARMAELSDGFLALPGGVGTLEELFEVFTWGLLGLHAKPVGLWDVEGLFAPLVHAVDHLTAEGFVRPPDRGFLLDGADLDGLLDRMESWRAPTTFKWMRSADET